MSNIVDNDVSKTQSRCKQDVSSKTKGVCVLRDPHLSKVQYSVYRCTLSRIKKQASK